MHKKGISFVILSIVGVFAMLGVIASGGDVFAAQSCTTDSETGVITCSNSAKASVVVSTSCGFVATGGGSYNLTLANNSTSNVNGSKFTTTCNSPNGYALYAVGFSGNQVGNTNLLAQTIGSAYDIQTGSGSSNWKMNLTSSGDYGTVVPEYDAGTGTTKNYANIPATYTKVAYYEPASGDTSTQSVFQTNYQATVSSTQPADNYVGQVKYVLIPTNGSISKSIFELEYMQDFASLTSAQKADVLSSMITNEQYQLKDSRDEKTYYISKLTDGNVWMTENLDLDFNTTNPDGSIAMRTFTSNDTNLTLYGSKGYDTNNGYSCSNDDPTCTGGTITWTPERATIAPEDLSSTTWKNDNSNPYSYDRGNVEPDGYKDGHGQSGNYYNWTAAIASNNSSSYVSDGNAANSICPKGWRLPNAASVDGGYEFSKMLYAYGVTKDDKNTAGYATGGYNKMVASPLYFVRSGYVYNGSLISSAIGGYYWSSAVGSTSGAFNLFFTSGIVNPANYYNRYRGWSVRCLAE
ncbi:hypothetical protein IKF43_02665 [Candidatus Saccharibacteria bacterium]|nr:hypothetical protein [Candidatus Saccharibacteria bacterium]